jgi:peptidoglycan hydrolase CwlO-like protein
MRNPAIALGAATLATVIFLGLVVFSQLSQVQGDIDALASTAGQQAPASDVLDDLRALDARIDSLNDRLDEMAVRFDRLDASISEIPTETVNQTQIDSLVSDVQSLQRLLDGLSLDLGVVCDVVGC